jgi:hypothetical protein
MAKKKSRPEPYTQANAPRCRKCGKTATDWTNVNGIRWAVRLKPDANGRWLCTICETGRQTASSAPAPSGE